jgi:hypothetical protein
MKSGPQIDIAVDRVIRTFGSLDASISRLTDLARDCPACGQLSHYRCKVDGHYVPTHPERMEITDEPPQETTT